MYYPKLPGVFYTLDESIHLVFGSGVASVSEQHLKGNVLRTSMAVFVSSSGIADDAVIL